MQTLYGDDIFLSHVFEFLQPENCGVLTNIMKTLKAKFRKTEVSPRGPET